MAKLAPKSTPKPRSTRKTKLPPKKGLRALHKELWRVFSKYIRQRDKFICYTCGKPGNEAGHYYHSKGYLIHFDERAVHCQCPSCNRWLSGKLQEYSLRLVRDYGPDILEEFNRLRNRSYKPTREEYEKRIAHYKAL